ncbi:TPA: hypothetical protein NJY08_004775 [Salmonella enterica subsp. enterica serovar Typhi str. AG3]|nr:hypothetical protein [Salmonella enterica subsp. enterica serovar Typhi str. AG3]
MRQKSSFPIVKMIDGRLVQVDIDAATLRPISFFHLSEIPKEWSVQDLDDFISEGERFALPDDLELSH